jgi:hypothetical protein
MKPRQSNGQKNNMMYTEKEIKLATSMVKQIEDSLDLMFYFMERSRDNSFVLMLMTAENVDLKPLLEAEKRNTDIVYDINSEENVCAMICQETKVEGGYRFAERIIRNLVLDKGEDIYCSEIEVRTTKYSAKDVIFSVLDGFVRARQEKKSGEIIFKSVY